MGGFEKFGRSRLEQFWEVQQLARGSAGEAAAGQAWLLLPPTLEALPTERLREPTRSERLRTEWEVLSFTASVHPLHFFDNIHLASYRLLNRAWRSVGQEIMVCGLVVEQRIHQQATGEPMKFLTFAEKTEISSTNLFANTYRSYGLATVR